MPPRRTTTTAAPAISEERAGVHRGEVAGLLREARAACPDDTKVGAEVACVAGRLMAVGKGDREAVSKLYALSCALFAAGANGVAVAVARKSAQIGEEAWGARDVRTAWELYWLVHALRRAGEGGSEEVGALLERADQIHDRSRETDPTLSRCICEEMGRLHLAKGRGRDALTCARRHVRMVERAGKDAVGGELEDAHELLGDALAACSKHEEAKEAYEKCVQVSMECGKAMETSGEHNGARGAYEVCMDASEKAHGPAAAETLQAAVRLAGCMQKLGNPSGAAELLRPVVMGYSDGLQAAGMPDDEALAEGLMMMGGLCLVRITGPGGYRAVEGAVHLRRAFLFFCRAHGRYDEHTLEALVALGWSLYHAGDLDDAEPLLRRGLQLARSHGMEHLVELNLAHDTLAQLLERRIEQLPRRTALRTRLKRDLRHYLLAGRALPPACSLPTCARAQMQGQPNFLVCDACGLARYCSEDCQCDDWVRGHEAACTGARQMAREGARERGENDT